MYETASDDEAAGIIRAVAKYAGVDEVNFLIRIGRETEPYEEDSKDLRALARKMVVREKVSAFIRTQYVRKEDEAEMKTVIGFLAENPLHADFPQRDLDMIFQWLKKVYESRNKIQVFSSEEELVEALINIHAYEFLVSQRIHGAVRTLYNQALPMLGNADKTLGLRECLPGIMPSFLQVQVVAGILTARGGEANHPLANTMLRLDAIRIFLLIEKAGYRLDDCHLSIAGAQI